MSNVAREMVHNAWSFASWIDVYAKNPEKLEQLSYILNYYPCERLLKDIECANAVIQCVVSFIDENDYSEKMAQS